MGFSNSALPIVNTGITVAAASTSAKYTVPNKTPTDTNSTRIVRVICDQNSAFIKFGGSSVVATTNDIMITPQGVLLIVDRFTNFAVIQNGSLACNVNVCPIAY